MGMTLGMKKPFKTDVADSADLMKRARRERERERETCIFQAVSGALAPAWSDSNVFVHVHSCTTVGLLEA